ncbi:GAF domain-containing protein [Mycolicibacterium baixiangningiae]|uniref:GAF domain-containing protein n=1 Tax=Mycolicibacterium baixiangningiae TaxID=2761578 RepID=UPI001867A77F|nr:GAF domain-containing protein [Mycolicibacterium baixiangningiae]
MSAMVLVYRAPMRSRDDGIDAGKTIARGRRLGVCGFGELGVDDDRLARRIARFADVPDGALVWTRDPEGLFWLGRIEGPYRHDSASAASAVDLVHVRPCRWLAAQFLESEVPAAVLATYRRGGRNFQQTHDAAVGPESLRLWEARTAAG